MTAMLDSRELRRRIAAAGDDPARQLQAAFDQLRAQAARIERRDGREAADAFRRTATDQLVDLTEGAVR